MLMPLLIMVTTGLKTVGEIFQYPPTLFPKHPVFSNYVDMFAKLNFFSYFKNSMIISGLVVVGTILSAALVAFGFSRYRAPGKKALFMISLSYGDDSAVYSILQDQLY